MTHISQKDKVALTVAQLDEPAQSGHYSPKSKLISAVGLNDIDPMLQTWTALAWI